MLDHVALIEDDDDSREIIRMRLERAGYRVTSYASATVALDEMVHGSVPDVLVLDLMMPGMNGWQFRVLQRRQPTISEVPVIVLSGDSSPHAQAIDAHAYIQKPVDVDRLCAVIAKVLIETKREQLAHKAVEMERLRSLGMLVASVAHEVNNPLTYLVGNLDLLERNLASQRLTPTETLGDLDERIRENVDAIRDGAERVAFIVRLLSTFARSDEADVKGVDVLRAIDAAIRLTQLQVREKARLVCNFEPLPRVTANEARLAQVFLNLLVNAAHATPAGAPDQHIVTIRTYTAEHQVVVEVEDTGVGISEQIQERIFEPFYTTKPAGTGTGLGLSISRDIVTAAGGSLTFTSQRGSGTIFRVTLPPETREPEMRASLAERPAPKPLRVLVVDDEPMIGHFVEAALSMCAVETTTDPRLALAWLKELTYDLILCDLIMPEMTGFEFYRAMIACRPDLQNTFVLATGSALDEALREFVNTTSVLLLRKPFTVHELKALVARVSAEEAQR